MGETYSPSSGDVLIFGAHPVTERLTRIGGIMAACGQASLLVILSLMGKTGYSPSDVLALVKQMIAAGFAGSGGTSTPKDLEWAAKQHGVTLDSVNWQSALQQDAGVVPIEIGVGNATVLGGNDARDNVHGHYVTVVGKTHDGQYIVSDPNSEQSTQGEFMVYSYSELASANPFWAAVPANFGDSQGGGNGGSGSGGYGGIGDGGLGGVGGALGGISSALGGIANALSPLKVIASYFTKVHDWIVGIMPKVRAFADQWLNPANDLKIILAYAIIIIVIGVVILRSPAGQAAVSDARQAVSDAAVAAIAA